MSANRGWTREESVERILRMLAAGLFVLLAAGAASALDIRSAVIRVDYPQLAPISRFDLKPEDMGFAGAMLAVEDNATTGQFLGHTFANETVAVPPEEAEAALDRLAAEGIRIFVILANAEDTLRLADRAGPDALVINAGSPAESLREDQCRANLLHVAPSQAMLADAVAQFSVWKGWKRWFLVHGSNPADQDVAEAYRQAARKFGLTVAEEREFEDTGGSRRSDSGHVLVQQRLPVFMQEAEEHDVVVAADASDVFAPYLPFHLWSPRPVMGAAGLRPVSFHASHEAWGATQFQTRFEKLTGRYVREEDYQAWLALRVVGETVTRAASDDIATLRAYALGDAFELAAFKGQKVTFRPWNGQLRQPILLFDGRITVSVSPQDGFLHQTSPLDTMGRDQPETACTAFD